MSSLTPLESEIEELADQYDMDGRYDEDAVLSVYELLERTRQNESKAMNRQSTTRSTSWSTGMYTHGGVSGLRHSALRMPSTTRFLVKAAKELTGSQFWGGGNRTWCSTVSTP